MKKLPIGIQTFSKLREGDFIYVDKTEYIYNIITGNNYYFLSRPRRFGKSLTLSTIAEIYSGSKNLFTGLWIENNWNWEKKHPVIHISFNALGYVDLGLQIVFRMN
ncbi:MAG: AAA family ATPase [Sphingobacteriales bacterium]|nr:AAA family ATPase [Sphingobacteriales bacterium]